MKTAASYAFWMTAAYLLSLGLIVGIIKLGSYFVMGAQ